MSPLTILPGRLFAVGEVVERRPDAPGSRAVFPLAATANPLTLLPIVYGWTPEATGAPELVPDRTRHLHPAGVIPAWALDDVPFGIGLLQVPQLTFVYSNRVYESWFQPDRRPIVGKRLQEALVAAPQVVSIFQQVAEDGVPRHFNDAEFVGLRNRPVELPGGATRWDWSVWPIKGSGGEVTHLLVSGYDVTAPALDRLRLGQSHEAGIRALMEVSRVAGVSGSIEEFFGELSAIVARVVHASKVLFARASGGNLVVQPATHGFDDSLLVSLAVPCAPDGDGIADRVVFRDEVFRASIDKSPEFETYRPALAVMDVRDAISVSWRVGELRLGLVAAFNSTRGGGFEYDDLYLLKTAAAAAGLVWHHRDLQARLAAAQDEEHRKLRQAADEMAALEHRKAEFLRFASHEMRGPLSILRAYLSLLGTDSKAVFSSPSETNAVMRAKVDELTRVVDQILEVSRLEDPTVSLDLSTFDLRDVVREAVLKVKSTQSTEHAVRLDAGTHPVQVRADRERISMILANLLDNAFKYSPPRTTVGCEVRTTGDQVEVRVSDQGHGIDANDLPKLFNRFSRVGGAEATAIPGTGLGLYLCREAARLHHGDIRVMSEPGKGSSFILVLPMDASS